MKKPDMTMIRVNVSDSHVRGMMAALLAYGLVVRRLPLSVTATHPKFGLMLSAARLNTKSKTWSVKHVKDLFKEDRDAICYSET